MSTILNPPEPQESPIVYPDSDGEPIAENTAQFDWIVKVALGLQAVFLHQPNVFVAGDLLWYPVKGRPEIRTAPDAMVAFGRPQGDRGSYMQWEEDGIAPQVVFEILSPTSRLAQMAEKFQFYETYGVQEYYAYNHDTTELTGWQRVGAKLQPIPAMDGWTSPLVGVRFELSSEELKLIGPDGLRFLTHLELCRLAKSYRQQAEAYRQQAEAANQRAAAYRQQAEAANQRAAAYRQQAERYAEMLRELGIDPTQL